MGAACSYERKRADECAFVDECAFIDEQFWPIILLMHQHEFPRPVGK